MGENHPYFRRKTPEELLEEIAESKRGQLKLYVGAAPGVGKTYKMLQDACELGAEGKDIVIGLIETHGRAETEEQIMDLEQVPLKAIEYKGKIFYELNVEAIISRSPEIVLVDELAHTNIPGSKHVKRYLDVEELLDAGIHVLSAVNIQHLESVNDIVYQITGVAVRERVPDTFIQKANEVQLIDVTPETLQKRLKEGKLYKQEKIAQSLNHFFTSSNLSSLRELALREVADDVDEKNMQNISNSSLLHTGVHEKILVCVQYGPTAERLIRRGFRMASRLKAELYILNVIGNASNISSEKQQKINQWKQLAKQFNAEFLLQEANKRKPAKAIVEIAAQYKITQILLGQSAKSRWEEIIRGSIVNSIMRETSNIEIHIVSVGK
ncbi:KdpD-like non-kinase potassium sensor [Niallia sp. 01092]|uniref:KdpD-like non-kinase potassium sensor n=1 Tax=unclassified Niallia TaxID=2837522 RepID=UPI003FD5955F